MSRLLFLLVLWSDDSEVDVNTVVFGVGRGEHRKLTSVEMLVSSTIGVGLMLFGALIILEQIPPADDAIHVGRFAPAIPLMVVSAS